MTYKLVIAGKAYSSWSLRPWIAMKHFGIPFEEIMISYEHADWKERALKYSPAGLVPVLIDGDLTIWDSLAIFEYLAEKHPEKPMWPKDAKTRAVARSVAAEMHSGFADLRKYCPCNFRRANKPRTNIPAEAKANIARIENVWHDMIARFGGPYLMGEAFTLADAMYAPVANRFYAYDLSKDAIANKYVATLYALPAYREWLQDAAAESYYIKEMEDLA